MCSYDGDSEFDQAVADGSVNWSLPFVVCSSELAKSALQEELLKTPLDRFVDVYKKTEPVSAGKADFRSKSNFPAGKGWDIASKLLTHFCPDLDGLAVGISHLEATKIYTDITMTGASNASRFIGTEPMNQSHLYVVSHGKASVSTVSLTDWVAWMTEVSGKKPEEMTTKMTTFVFAQARFQQGVPPLHRCNIGPNDIIWYPAGYLIARKPLNDCEDFVQFRRAFTCRDKQTLEVMRVLQLLYNSDGDKDMGEAMHKVVMFLEAKEATGDLRAKIQKWHCLLLRLQTLRQKRRLLRLNWKSLLKKPPASEGILAAFVSALKVPG
jgi:hypothetical protein